ncbi:MAG: sulfide/dihydroorotate dehydrogenase-like FAD/NAD-binding protein [Acidimicrobiia bacterium]|nr:sulfide/dihydroorotate dehydrogenase-like FAD/NAD-binding protein [Acidimicrobiia bacterium]
MSSVRRVQRLAPEVTRLWLDAPRVARHWSAGQFVIVRVDHDGERIPLTIAAGDPDEGWISLIVQNVGATTARLTRLEAGDEVVDVAGPLGRPTDIDHYGTVVVIGGGVGTAIAYPSAGALAAAGNRVIAIVGGRSRPYVLLEDELAEVCDRVIPVTDDGSHGVHGLVTDALAMVLASEPVDRVLAIGPIPMMRAVAELTRPAGLPTVVSLNPIMVDGTGMCGGCRVLVGGETRFACVDGPEFDAHQVDFEVLARRNRAYATFEAAERDRCVSIGISGEVEP